MKIMKLFYKLICLLLALIMFATPAYADEEQGFAGNTDDSSTLDSLQPLLGSARIANTDAAILYEVGTDTLLYGWNIDQSVYPSSLVKLATAIVAIENADLQADVTATADVLSAIPSGAVSVGLQDGEQMKLIDLLHCMLVGSGNDAAAVIANYVGGSEEAFVEQLNAFAKEVGCIATNFTNAHGLHDVNQVTTARDMAKIIAYAIDNETFLELICTAKHTVPATNLRAERNLTTNNYLITRSGMEIYYDARVKGGRTGVTNDGKRCVASVAEKGNMQVISIVLGCWTTYHPNGTSIKKFGGFPETTELLNRGFQGMQAVQIFHPGQILKQYSINNGANDLYLGIKEARSTVLPAGVKTQDLRYIYEEAGILAAPLQKDSAFGKVKVFYGNNCVASAELYVMNAVPVYEENAITDRYKDASQGFQAWWILVIVLILFVIALLILRYSKKFRKIAKRNARRRRTF